MLYSDNGIYTCHASNTIGQSVANITMNFYGKQLYYNYVVVVIIVIVYL